MKRLAPEGWQGVRKVVIAEVEAERQAAEREVNTLLRTSTSVAENRL
jgi:hypothetical protein